MVCNSDAVGKLIISKVTILIFSSKSLVKVEKYKKGCLYLILERIWHKSVRQILNPMEGYRALGPQKFNKRNIPNMHQYSNYINRASSLWTEYIINFFQTNGALPSWAFATGTPWRIQNE
jgi:hypothetical protein